MNDYEADDDDRDYEAGEEPYGNDGSDWSGWGVEIPDSETDSDTTPY